MIINIDIESQWTSEMEDCYLFVLQNYEASKDKIEEALDEFESFTEFCMQAIEQESELCEDLTIEEWRDTVHVMVTCTHALLRNVSHINSVFKIFVQLMYLPGENIFLSFPEIAEEIIELFISVQLEAEDCMREAVKIRERFGRVAQIAEN